MINTARLALTSLALLACVECSREPVWTHEGTFRGVYASNFENSMFVPKDAKEYWWLDGGVPCDVPSLATKRWRPVLFIEMRATLSDKGSFGHLGMYDRQITPSAFLVCRRATPEEWKSLAAEPMG
jgi:hypothetical protein